MAGKTQLLPRFPHRLGKYEVLEKIGEGGYSCVYRGFDPLIQRPVAIKTCPSADRETRERFYREAQIAGNLDHSNIVRVYDLFLEDGAPYLVQELLGGDDLDVKIERREAISFAEKLFYLLQVARGLEFAHSRGVIHRDVKPANVRVLEDGTAKILDFGIAKLAHYASDLTQAGMTVGTAAYLAPEQIRGEDATPETDIFSFGVLAYELLTYVRPFGRETISETFYQTLHHQPAALTVHWARCPPGLVDLVNRCLRKDPSQRFGSCRQVVRQLEEIRDRLRGEWVPGADPAATRALPIGDRRPPSESPNALSTEPPTEPPTQPSTEAPAAAPPPPATVLGDPRELEPRPRLSAPADLPLRTRPRGMSIAGATRKRRRSRAWMVLLLVLVASGAAAWRWLPGSVPGARLQEAWERLSSVADPTGTPAPRQSSAAADGAAREAAPAAPGTAGASPGSEPLQLVGGAPAAASEPTEVPSTREPREPLGAVPSNDGSAAAGAGGAAQAQPAPSSATLSFDGVWSPGIQVSVDGESPVSLGRSRVLQLEPGSHSLTFSIDTPGFRTTRSLRLSIDPGESRRLTVPIAQPGRLTVQAHLGTPQGLASIDGGTPRPTPLRGLHLTPGTHRIRVSSRERPDVPRIETSIEVRSGYEAVMTFDLESGREPHLRERPVRP